MLGAIDYDKKMDRKRKWYKENGRQDQLIETPIEGMSLKESIKYILEDRFGLEEVDRIVGDATSYNKSFTASFHYA